MKCGYRFGESIGLVVLVKAADPARSGDSRVLQEAADPPRVLGENQLDPVEHLSSPRREVVQGPDGGGHDPEGSASGSFVGGRHVGMIPG